MIRFFDIFFSSLAILVLFPFMIPIMLILKLTGEHYIFYKQKRVGRHGKEFGLIKFATMLKDSPNMPGGLFTIEHDPRILPLGNFLRKTKINELPQLVNVFMGQMSIVGYRPLVRWSYDQYSDGAKQKLYNMKPGLSGIASIVLRNEEEIVQKIGDTERFYRDVIMPYKGTLEIWFIDNYNLFIYFKVIFITILVVLKPDSKSWKKLFRNMPLPHKELEKYI